MESVDQFSELVEVAGEGEAAACRRQDKFNTLFHYFIATV